MTTVTTPAGELIVGARYNLTLARNDVGEKRIDGAVVVAIEPAPVGHCPTCTCLAADETRYELHAGDGRVLGVVPAHVVAAEAL